MLADMRTRQGFTLVEVLVAVVLIDIGLLALVAASAVLVRQVNAFRLRNVALRAATNRLQQLGTSTCAPASGVSFGDGIREVWSVTLPSPRSLDIQDSVTITVGASRPVVVLHTRLPC
jgi:type II secretion system protein I